MASLTLTRQARNDIDDVVDSVVEFTGYEQSGVKLYTDIFKKLDLIAFIPRIGTLRDDGTFETFVRNYRIVYELVGDDVLILTIIHTRRLYPRPE